MGRSVIFMTRFLVSLFVFLLTEKFVLSSGTKPDYAVLLGFVACALSNLLGDICTVIIGPPPSIED